MFSKGFIPGIVKSQDSMVKELNVYSAKIKSTHFIIPNIFFIIVLTQT